MLDENAAWMQPEKLQEHVDALNDPRPERDTLATLWEVAVLNALSKFVTVSHEPRSESKKNPDSEPRKPDIIYQVNGEQVVSDIRTVSDKDRHAKNPIERLNDEFAKRMSPLIRAGVKGGFYLAVRERSQRRTIKEGPAPELSIPHVSQFKAAIFNQDFNQFLAALKRSPNQKHSYRINTSECNVEFGFDPLSSGWTLNKPLYTQATILNKNTLWNALESKREQLADATISGHRGIIICDGGCRLLQTSGSWDQYGADEIIRAFLRKHKSIEFVLVLVSMHKGHPYDLCPENHFVWSKLYHNFGEVPDWLIPISRIASALPQVCNTALNAKYELEYRRKNKIWNDSHGLGGVRFVSNKQIKVSARALLQLLAGILKQEQFESQLQTFGGNPFLQKLANGQLIGEVKLEKDGLHENDQLITFEFGDPHPAISPFRAKETSARRSP